MKLFTFLGSVFSFQDIFQVRAVINLAMILDIARDLLLPAQSGQPHCLARCSCSAVSLQTYWPGPGLGPTGPSAAVQEKILNIHTEGL